MSDDNIVPMPGIAPPLPVRYCGEYVPPVNEILDDIAACRGNVVQMLNTCAPGQSHDAVMFRILLALAKNPEAKAEWDMIVKVGDELTCLMMHARLLEGKTMLGPDVDAKEIIAILERLMPDKWARKSIQKPKNNEKLSDLMK